jgi:hypothetical protein
MDGLGRLESKNLDHTVLYGVSAVMPTDVEKVNQRLVLPKWNPWDQKTSNSCCGHGASMMLSIMNSAEIRAQGIDADIMYDPWWLWDRAKELDHWEETVPGDNNGTTVHAACDALRTLGHCVWNGKSETARKGTPLLSAGIRENRWATTVNEIRSVIAAGIPCAIGVNWYTDFCVPELGSDGYHWIGKKKQLGSINGGHCVVLYGAWDDAQCFEIVNSWGTRYPAITRLPYTTMARLLNEGGECALVTDRS